MKKVIWFLSALAIVLSMENCGKDNITNPVTYVTKDSTVTINVVDTMQYAYDFTCHPFLHKVAVDSATMPKPIWGAWSGDSAGTVVVKDTSFFDTTRFEMSFQEMMCVCRRSDTLFVAIPTTIDTYAVHLTFYKITVLSKRAVQ